MFVDQTEVRGRVDRHRHLIKHTTTDPPRHFFHLCTMEGQWAGNRRPRVALLPSHRPDKPQLVHKLTSAPPHHHCPPLPAGHTLRHPNDASDKYLSGCEKFRPFHNKIPIKKAQEFTQVRDCRPVIDDITGVCAVFVPEGFISQGTGSDTLLLTEGLML